MKCTIVIDKETTEEIVIRVRERTALVDEIERLVQGDEHALIGYRDSAAMPLDIHDVVCFSVQGGKVFAVVGREQWQVKQRLYQLEASLPRQFVKIHQSCIANIQQIARFDTSMAGTLAVTFKNGYTDFVARRQLGHVKERLGL